MSHLDPDPTKECALNESFLGRHSLLCRWQKQLEFFLYHLCRSVAPALTDQCHWSCPEAAELSLPSEKVTEFFCFHHKKHFQSHGITEYEREAFCANLHKIRQIRHCAVHRVPVNAATIAQYAQSAQHVLVILKRLGGTEFQETFSGLIDQSLDTFWDVRSSFTPQANFRGPSARQKSDDSSPSNLFLERKAANIRSMRELQNSAMERKLANIAKMGEDIETANTQTEARQKRLCQQNEECQQRKVERARRSQQERDEAERKKNERARRSQQERDEAERKKNERAQRSQQERNEVERKKTESKE